MARRTARHDERAFRRAFLCGMSYDAAEFAVAGTFDFPVTIRLTGTDDTERYMNKAEFVDAVADKASMSKADATTAVDAVLDSLTEAMKQGEQITLVGFGTFLVRKREARTGRNPRTGEPLEIAASNAPSFKAGKALKDAVN